MIFGIKYKSIILTRTMYFGYCYTQDCFCAPGSHIFSSLFCDQKKSGKEKVFSVYTDCTLITIKLSLVKYLSKIRRQIIGDCPAVYFISEPTNNFFVNYTYINIILLIYYYYYI